jgi:Putative peptidoglycan binding domain
MNSFEFVTSKLGRVDPETRSIARELYDAAVKAGHNIRFMWGLGSSSEHATGNALDLMVYNEAAGDFLRNYIWANRSRLRLKHVIWEQHITSTVVQPGVRRKMPDRGSVTQNHEDHVHVLFYPGVYRPPVKLSGGAGAPVTQPPASKPPVVAPTVSVRTLQRGSVGEDVRTLQRGLNRVFPGYPGPLLVTDGRFGPETDKDVREFQRRTGLTVDGKVGPATRAKLRAHGIRL